RTGCVELIQRSREGTRRRVVEIHEIIIKIKRKKKKMDLSVKINRRDGNMAAKRKKYDKVLLLYVGNKVFFFPIWGFSRLIGKYY
ncbi:Uncharacterized protein FWK35_00030373, partial [Aphis craccivora]